MQLLLTQSGISRSVFPQTSNIHPTAAGCKFQSGFQFREGVNQPGGADAVIESRFLAITLSHSRISLDRNPARGSIDMGQIRRQKSKEPPQIKLNKLREYDIVQGWPPRKGFKIGC